MTYTPEFFKKEANDIKSRIERFVTDGGDLCDYFEGCIYGEDGGRYIIGFGVYGPNGHILFDSKSVRVAGYDSETFDAETQEALRDFIKMMENC